MTARAPSPRAVTLVPATRAASSLAHLVRASGERWTRLPFDSTAPLGPLPCEWHTAETFGDAAAWATASTWTTREARALLPHLAARAPGGRPATAPQSPDGDLVAAALATGRYPTREALAAAVGCSRKALSRACAPVGKPGHYDLQATARDALRAIVAEGKA